MKYTGVIYILTNPSFPDYVKIGYADDLDRRLSELNRSECTPFAFRAYATYAVTERLTDLKLHTVIDTLNPGLRSIDTVNGKKRVREFYAITAEEAYSIFEAIAEISGTKDRLTLVSPTAAEVKEEETAEAINTTAATKKRPHFTFSMLGIGIGEKLTYIPDPTITVTVTDDKHVVYNGEVYSLSTLDQELGGFKLGRQGTQYFSYNDKPLTELRAELENK